MHALDVVVTDHLEPADIVRDGDELLGGLALDRRRLGVTYHPFGARQRRGHRDSSHTDVPGFDGPFGPF